jgi:hypothetical protein
MYPHKLYRGEGHQLSDNWIAGVSARADERKKLERLSAGGPDDTSAARQYRKGGFR